MEAQKIGKRIARHVGRIRPLALPQPYNLLWQVQCESTQPYIKPASPKMSTLEVFIDRILEDGRTVVTNNVNAEIPLGTNFTELQLRSVAQSDGAIEADLRASEGISLCLTSVNIFRKDVQEIFPGFSAAINLKGDGMEKLEEFLSLKTKSAYVFLVAIQSS